MTIDKDKITEIFFMADNFCQLYDRFIKINGLARKRDKSKRKYHRGSTLSDAEVITIMILFHLCGYKCLKHFYIDEVCENMAGLAAYSFFPKKPYPSRYGSVFFCWGDEDEFNEK